MSVMNAPDLAARRQPNDTHRNPYPADTGIFEGAVVVYDNTSSDNGSVVLPNHATALSGGRAFYGISDMAGSPASSGQDAMWSVQCRGIAKCALKNSTACVRGGVAAYDPADAGYVVPYTSAKQVQIGRFTETLSSGTGQLVGVQLDKLGQGVGDALIGAITSNSAAVTNTTTETTFDQSVSIPANRMAAGSVIRIRAKVNVTSGNAADTLTLKLKVAGVAVVTSAAVDVTDGGGDLGVLDAVVTIRSTTTATAAGFSGLGAPGAATLRVGGTASTFVVDTTAATAVIVTATWSAASASNSCRLEDLVVTEMA